MVQKKNRQSEQRKQQPDPVRTEEQAKGLSEEELEKVSGGSTKAPPVEKMAPTGPFL